MKVQRKYLQLACLNLFLVMSVILCPHQTYAKGKKFKIYFTNAEKSIKLPLKSSQTLSVRYSKKKKQKSLKNLQNLQMIVVQLKYKLQFLQMKLIT